MIQTEINWSVKPWSSLELPSCVALLPHSWLGLVLQALEVNRENV